MTYCRFRQESIARLFVEGVSRVARDSAGGTSDGCSLPFHPEHAEAQSARIRIGRGKCFHCVEDQTRRSRRRERELQASASLNGDAHCRSSVIREHLQIQRTAASGRSGLQVHGQPRQSNLPKDRVGSRLAPAPSGRIPRVRSVREGTSPAQKECPIRQKLRHEELRTGPPSGVTSKVPSRRFTRMR